MANIYKDTLNEKIDEFTNLGFEIHSLDVSPEVWEALKDSVNTFHVGAKTTYKYRGYTLRVNKKRKNSFSIAVVTYNYYEYHL